MKISNKNSNNRSVGEKGEEDEVLELPIGILQDNTGQMAGNKRTHPIRTLSRNNNTTTGLKKGPNPLSGVLIPQALRGGNPLPPFHESIKSPGYREVLILSLGS